MLSKDAILNADDRSTVDIDVPEWGGSVRLQVMSAQQRDDYEQALFHSKKGERLRNVRASLVAFCVVDDDGNAMFAAEDVEALGRKSAAAVNRLFEAAQKLNKMTDDDLEESKGN